MKVISFFGLVEVHLWFRIIGKITKFCLYPITTLSSLALGREMEQSPNRRGRPNIVVAAVLEQRRLAKQRHNTTRARSKLCNVLYPESDNVLKELKK